MSRSALAPRLALLLAAAAAAPPMLAAEGLPQLVRDVDPRPVREPGRYGVNGAAPKVWASVGGRAVFGAFTPTTGYETWGTDGTSLGTELLADVCLGPCGQPPQFVGVANGVLFFLGSHDGGSPHELWRTDGTRRGTFRLPVGIADFFSFALGADGLYFDGCGAGDGCEPWRSDGTVEGTQRILDLESGAMGSNPTTFAAAGGRVIFTAPHRGEIWSTDGTAGGTAKILTGHGIAAASSGSRAFLVADTGADRFELWMTDGTAAGTRKLTAFTPLQPFELGPRFVPFAGGVYFQADDGQHGREVWRSDGTVAGTRRLTDLPDGPLTYHAVGSRLVVIAYAAGAPRLWTTSGAQLAQPLIGDCPGGCPEVAFTEKATAGERLVFVGIDGAGAEPWATDGTAAGTRRLRDVCPGPCDGGIRDLASHLGQAFFAAEDAPQQGTELWATDGSPAGTRRVSDFAVADAFDAFDQGSFRGGAAGGRLVFGAADPDHGLQPWSTDGTLAGTRLLTLIGGGNGSAPAALGAVPGGIGFLACDGEVVRVYRSDGSAAATVPIATPDPPVTCGDGTISSYTPALVNGGQIFFIHTSHDDPALWRIGGDGSGLVRLVSLPDRAFGFTQLVPFGGGVAFFTVGSSLSGFELWTSDGMPAGTRAAALDPNLSHPGSLSGVGGRLYFTAGISGPDGADYLWTSDGTTAGTVTLATGVDRAQRFVALGAWTYFVADGELWRTDGTPAGTGRVWTEPSGYPSVTQLTGYAGALFFSAYANAEADAFGLWRSDGSATGTALVREIPASVFARGPLEELAVAGGLLYFSALDEAHGRELWASDGTAAGTALVYDLMLGPRSSFPSGLTAGAGALYFSAHDGAHGDELWRSDGTAAGTRMLADVAPGVRSSLPRQLTVSAGRLFWSADDGLHGGEPWAATLAGSPACVPGDARLCLAGGRYAVEATWRDFQGGSGIGHAVGLTGDTGYFWFFGPENIEVILKVLDATTLNGHRWVFYGALSSVEYTLTVTDTQTGAVKRYVNPGGALASVGDTQAFGPNGATGAPVVVARTGGAAAPVGVPSRAAAAGAPCVASATTHCLQGGRFAVSVRWKDFQGNSGDGRTIPLTGDTGAFWFFGAENVELVLKVLDGRPLNGKFWVFYGALSSVEYEITVTDTATGDTRTYRNPSGRMASVADTGAF